MVPCEGFLCTTSHPSITVWFQGMLVFHAVAYFFQYLDRGKFAQRWRTTSAKSLPTYTDMLPQVIFNQVFILLPSMLVLDELRVCFHPPTPSLSPLRILLELMVLLIMSLGHDIVFYIAHRFLLHSSWGYRLLGHNLHHSSRAHCAVSAMYMSGLDFALEIVAPYLIPLAVASKIPHSLATNYGLALGSIGGLLEHSGYNFLPGVRMFDTTAHRLHHERLTCSFSDGVGSTNFSDEIFGTSCAAFVPKAARAAVASLWRAVWQKSDHEDSDTFSSRVTRFDQ